MIFSAHTSLLFTLHPFSPFSYVARSRATPHLNDKPIHFHFIPYQDIAVHLITYESIKASNVAVFSLHEPEIYFLLDITEI